MRRAFGHAGSATIDADAPAVILRARTVIPRAAVIPSAARDLPAKVTAVSFARHLAICCIALASVCVAIAREPSPADIVDEANRLLDEGEFAEALAAYERAAEMRPGSPELAYNRGVAHYRLGDYAQAAELFQRALTPQDPALDARARFNMGNCGYATALQQRQVDPGAAIEALQEAIGHYRDALDLAPDDRDARANIERSQRLIEKLRELQQQQQQQQGDEQSESQDEQQEEQQEQQQGDQQQEQQGQQQNQQQDQSQDEQSQGEQDEQQAAQEEQQEQPQDEQQQQQQQQGGDQQQGEQTQPQPAQMTPQELSREEAERLLQAIRDKERQRREARARREQATGVPVERDW